MTLRKRVKVLEQKWVYYEEALDNLYGRVDFLFARLAELEPELEQYKQAVEEAERQEKLRNDGMASIFGYMTPGMRGDGDGGQ